MNPLDPTVWEKLELARPAGPALTARPAAPAATHRILAALDSTGQHHWLIETGADEPALDDRRTRGFTATTRDLTLNSETRRYIDLACHDASGNPAFDLIGAECATALEDPSSSATLTVERILAKWRRFWGQVPQQLLSFEGMLGLFGELTFLLHWLMPLEGPGAVAKWRGPFGSRHDFEWVGHSVEVKATASTRGHIHRINGLDQLELPAAGDLHLFAIVVREEAGGDQSLPSLVAELKKSVGDDSDALTQIEAGLLHAGYSPAHEIEYAKFRLRVVDETVFAVRDNFPRLTRTILGATLLAGVEQVGYEINLNTYSHLVVGRNRPYPKTLLG